MTTQGTSTDKLLSLIQDNQSQEAKPGDLPRTEKNKTAAQIRHQVPPTSPPKWYSQLYNKISSFRFSRKHIVGVDIRDDSIILVKVANGTPRRLLEVHKLANTQSLPKNAPQFPSFLRDCLKECCGACKSTEVWSLVSLKDTDFWHLQIPKVPASSLYEAVFWSVKKEKQFDETKFLLDFEVQGEKYDGKTVKYEIMAFIVPHEIIDFQKSLFNQAGYKLKGLTLSPYATQSIFRSGWYEAAAETFATLYVGHEWSRVDVYSDGKLVLNRGIKTGTANMVAAFMDTMRSSKDSAPNTPPNPETPPFSPVNYDEKHAPQPSGPFHENNGYDAPVPHQETVIAPPKTATLMPPLENEPENAARHQDAPPQEIVAVDTSSGDIEFSMEFPEAPIPSSERPPVESPPQGDIDFSFPAGSIENTSEKSMMPTDQKSLDTSDPKDKIVSLAMKNSHVIDHDNMEPDEAEEALKTSQDAVDVDAMIVEVEVEPDGILLMADEHETVHPLHVPPPTEKKETHTANRPFPKIPDYTQDIPDFLSQDDVIELLGRAAEAKLPVSSPMKTEPKETLVGPQDNPANGSEGSTSAAPHGLEEEIERPNPARPLEGVAVEVVDRHRAEDMVSADSELFLTDPETSQQTTAQQPEKNDIAPSSPREEVATTSVVSETAGSPGATSQSFSSTAIHVSLPPENPEDDSNAGMESTFSEHEDLEKTAETDAFSDAKSQARNALFCALSDDNTKRSPGQAETNRKQAFAAIRPSAERLARQVERTLDYSRSILGHDPAEIIYLSGDVCLSDQFREYIQTELGMECLLLDPLGISPPAPGLTIPTTSEQRLQYNNATALALCDDGYTPNLLNTFADRFNSKRRQRLIRLVIGVSLIILLGLTGWYAWLEQIRQDGMQKLHIARQELAGFKPQVDQNLLLQLAAKIAATKRAVKASGLRYEPLAVTSEISRITPGAVKLFSLDIRFAVPVLRDPQALPRVGPQALQEKSPATGIVLEGFLTGKTEHFDTIMTEYLLTLEASPMFDTPRIIRREAAMAKSGEAIQRFALGMELTQTKPKEKSQ